MKKSLSGILIASLLLLAVGCGSNSSSSTGGKPTSTSSGSNGDVVKIGFIASATGPASSQGKPEMNTAKLLEEKINSSGGLGGKKVKIFTYDDESDETKGVLTIKKLISEDQVAAVVGGTITGNSLAMLKIAESEKVPYISMAAGYDITTPIKPYTFKTAQSETIIFPKIFKYLKDNNITKVAWMHVDDAYGDSGHNFFKKLAPEAGLQITAEEMFKPTDTDMTAQLSKIKLTNPQAIIVWTRPPSGSVVTKNYRQLGLNIPIIHSVGMTSESYLQQAADDANGTILAGSKLLVKDSLPDSDPQKKVLIQFAKEYKDKFNAEATTFSGHAYDGIMMVGEAIKNVGTDRNKIRDYLENNTKNFVGMTGVFTFSPQDHNGLNSDAVVMLVVKNKNWALLN